MSVAVITRSPSAPPCAHAGSGGAEPCPPANRKWVLVATILGSALAFMDGSVVNVALPALQAAFHATSGSIQWVVHGYALFGAALLLLGGAIGDHYGRRRTYVWGVALFALASAGCGCVIFTRSTGRGARRARHRRGAADTPGPVDPVCILFRRRARPRNRYLVGMDGRLRRGRPSSGRMAAAGVVVAADLPAESAGGCCWY